MALCFLDLFGFLLSLFVQMKFSLMLHFFGLGPGLQTVYLLYISSQLFDVC